MEFGSHLKPHRRVVSPPAGESRQIDAASMAFVYETPADGTGTGIEILVAAPHGEIDIPIVQVRQRVADAVSKVQAGRGAGTARRVDHGCQVQGLSGEILNTGQENQRQSGALLL